MGLPIYRKPASWFKNWWWSGFAFLLTIFFIGNLVFGFIENANYHISEIFLSSADIIGLLALWGLGLQKRFFKQFFWRLFIFIHALLFIISIFFVIPNSPSLLAWIITSFLISIIYVPYYTALFIYAFRARRIWKELEPKLETTFKSYPYFNSDEKWFRKYRVVINLTAILFLTITIICLSFIPFVLNNNHTIYPLANPPEVFKRVLEYNRITIPELRDFEILFPNYLFEQSDNYHDPNSSAKWSLIAGLHKRYLFVMEIDIIYPQVDPETNKLLSPGSHKEPTFILYEVIGSVSAPFVLFRPRFALASYESIKFLDTSEWRQLVEARGDFAALGIKLAPDSPIPDFELAFRNNDLRLPTH